MNRLNIVAVVLALGIVSTLPAESPSVPIASKASSTATEKPAPASTIASITDRQIHYAELEIVAAAEAMPQEKYDFAPNGPGDFKGVRTFGLQVKHIANMNYLFWSTVLGQTPPVTPKMIVENGPDSIRTKAELVKYLKDSYALGHRAANSLTAENCTERVVVDESNTGPKLFWTTFAISHDYDHYGQLVVYLRMNGIVPPTHDDGD
jgi:uncharacterized damage-inducible protein DinB